MQLQNTCSERTCDHAVWADCCLGLVGSAVLCGSILLYITALRSVPAAVAGSYFNLIPVFGVGLAYLFLGETLTPTQWLGAATILLSVFELVRLTAKGPALTVSMP
ncbi:EamA family transporter [Candidatus Phyllobacterium onerii]|uniref:EamA family transporter n=1 Tax=Candidatus Phyllobacterium onerii TaxID=3020828 RepID=UPI003A8A5C04